MKKLSIFLLFLMFFVFLFYQIQKSKNCYVLAVYSPTEIVVDMNGNGIKDIMETISFDDVQTFDMELSEDQLDYAKRLNLTLEDVVGLGIMADNFAKDNLLGKKVELRNFNKDIYVNGKNYKNMLLDEGLAFEDEKELSPEIKKNVRTLRAQKLVILNDKNGIYHRLICRYGVSSRRAQIMPESELPNGSKPCEYCFSKDLKTLSESFSTNTASKRYIKRTDKTKHKKRTKKSEKMFQIKTPPLEFQVGCMKIFLTDLTKVLKPSNSCSANFCKALLNEINSAQKTIDFAIYGYVKNHTIENALKQAQKRGVKIRFVYDGTDAKSVYPDTLQLAKTFTDNKSDDSSKRMHDKFFIFDGKKVLTGSANMSNSDFSGFNSNAVLLFDSSAVASAYTQEFEQMFAGTFNKFKKPISNKAYKLYGADVLIYFLPADKPMQEIISLIDGAEKYVYVPTFLLTHKAFSDSLIRAANRGVEVKVIIDATSAHGNYTAHNRLRANGVLVKTENFAGKIHSKSVIIDDLYTVIGSMNFSKSGETSNDENVVLIKNREIAKFYRAFFRYLWVSIPDKWLKRNARAESVDSVGSCFDGIDNDFDGKIDRADESCSTAFIKR